jgi:hypothetical protein
MKRIMIFYARMEAAEETRDALNDKVVNIVSGQADGLPPLSLLRRINRRSRSKSVREEINPGEELTIKTVFFQT